MAFWEWLALGAAGVFLHSQSKKNREEREHEQREHEEFLRDLHEREQEWERKRKVNSERKAMPCFFCDGMSQEDFEALAQTAAKRIKRIRTISVRGAKVYATVESQTGLSDWDFNVDFNNWGHITGTYWTYTENDDSSIPKHYGSILSSLVHDFLREHGISLEDFSDAVDDNKQLETSEAFNTNYKEHLMQRLFKKGYRTIHIERPSIYYQGEHLYAVLSLFKQYGFVNIRCEPIADVDDKNAFYIFEVDKISIAETDDFKCGYAFPHNAEVIIYFHSKRRITMPVSVGKLKRKNYIQVGDYLQELGFTQIYERKITDILLGVLTKDGSVEDVLVADDDEKQISQGEEYFYDTKIIITYHTRKR